MEFFTKVLSGNGRIKQRDREAEQANDNFKASLEDLKSVLESEDNVDVLALLHMVYDSSFPEEQVFMKTPSRSRLNSKKDLIVRLLIGLNSLGVPTMSEMLVFIKKHGLEEIADSLMTLLDCLSPLLEGKEAPEFSTDDVMEAMDLEWHSPSGVGSPLLNAIASATSSPRASSASIADSPFHPILSASPYRRAISDRAMLVSRAHELGGKSALDKASLASTSPSLTVSASSHYPSTIQGFHIKQPTILESPASPETSQASIDAEPSSHSIDRTPGSSQHGSQRRHRRKSSSLQQLFDEDASNEQSGEGSVDASKKGNSSSNSFRRNSSDMKKIISNISETSSSTNSGLAAGDSREGASLVTDKEFHSSTSHQDTHVNRSGQKGSKQAPPTPTPSEMAVWREDSSGFSADLVSNNESADRTLEDSEWMAGNTAAATEEDSINLSKSNILEQEKDILPACDSCPSSNKDFGESLCTLPETLQGNITCATNELLEMEECTGESMSDEDGSTACTDLKCGRFGEQCDSTAEPLENEAVDYIRENRKDKSMQDANEHHGEGGFEAIGFSMKNGLSNIQKNDRNAGECDETKDADVYLMSDKDHEMEVEQGKGNGPSCYDGASEIEHAHSLLSDYESNSMNVGYGFSTVDQQVDSCSSLSSSSNDNMSGENAHGFQARAHEYRDLSRDSDTRDGSSIGHTSTDCTPLVEDQLNNSAFDVALGNDSQTKQSTVLQQGIQRSHSDLTPAVSSLFKAELLKQEKPSPQHGSDSNLHVRTDKLRHRFARHFRSLTASMENLRSQGRSADRVVMHGSMPWMLTNIENNHQREEASEGTYSGSSSTSSSATSDDDAVQVKAPHGDGRAVSLHYLHTAVDDEDGLKSHEHDLRLKCGSCRSDVQDDERQAESSHDHIDDMEFPLSLSDNPYQDTGRSDVISDTPEALDADRVHLSQEDARHATSSLNDSSQSAGYRHASDALGENAGHALTHVKYSSAEENEQLSSHDSDESAGPGSNAFEEAAGYVDTHENARRVYSLDTCDQDAAKTQMAHHDQQDEFESAIENHTTEGTGHESFSVFQGTLAPPLHPSSSDICQENVDEQAGYNAAALENDKNFSNGIEREDKEFHAAVSHCEDPDSIQAAGDVNPSWPKQDQGHVDMQYDSLKDGDPNLSIILPSSDVVASSHEDANPITNGAMSADNNHLLDEQHPHHCVNHDEHVQELSGLDAVNMRTTGLPTFADNNSILAGASLLKFLPTHSGLVCMEEILESKNDQSLMQGAQEMKDDNPNVHRNLVEGISNSSFDADSVNHTNSYQNTTLEKPELIGEHEKNRNVHPLDVHVESTSGRLEDIIVSDEQFDRVLSELHTADEDVLSGGEVPLISDGTHEKMREEVQQEDFITDQVDKEKTQSHDNKMGITDETVRKADGESTTSVHAYPAEKRDQDEKKRFVYPSMVEEAVDKRDIDTNLQRSRLKKKGSRMRKLARGYLSCCSKFRTNV